MACGLKIGKTEPESTLHPTSALYCDKVTYGDIVLDEHSVANITVRADARAR